MKVILSADVEKLGRKGDVVEVARGYARNFLLPKKLALNATRGAVKQAESMRRARDEKERKDREIFEQLAQRIAATPLRIAAKAGADGQLFGSITTSDIADELERALGGESEIDRRKIELRDQIKSLGTHDYSLQLHADVVAQGTVEVVAE